MTKIHEADDVIGDRYKILRHVGEGGMQEVYEAEDLLLSRNVALKVPKNNSATKRFQRSAVVSARINHANVAKTLDYLDDKNRSYLIEEFITGKDLAKVLKKRLSKLDPLCAARILHHLAKGLAASHHADVIHRDIKPSNVMAEGGELLTEVKITDFGIAKMAFEEIGEAVEGGDASITASQTAIGALPYMAPEMIQSIKDAGKPADIWSIGALAYELLEGRKPFGFGLKAVPAIVVGNVAPMIAVKQAAHQFLPAAKAVQEIIMSCLQVDLTKRPTADELVRNCEALCYPITKREKGTVDRFSRPTFGYLAADKGDEVFFHVQNVYGDSVSVGDRVVFSRHEGGKADRAFPIMKITVPKK